MACSAARLAANRQNALRSTGPKSAAGKAASRQNAFQHGMAGAGDVLGPGEDETLVASRSAAFRVELGATTEVTQLFAHRAAVLSIRMERLANRELVAVAEARAVAQLQFDEEAAPERNRWIAGLAAGTASYRDVTRALEGSPAGLLALIDAWETALVEATADGSAVADRARSRLNSWLGLGETSGEVADRSRRMRAEVERLRGLADSQDALADQVARSRERRATLASFDTSAEATLARRYEAAAERGVYRALRTIQELNQGSKVHSAPLAELAPQAFDRYRGLSPGAPQSRTGRDSGAARP